MGEVISPVMVEDAFWDRVLGLRAGIVLCIQLAGLCLPNGYMCRCGSREIWIHNNALVSGRDGDILYFPNCHPLTNNWIRKAPGLFSSTAVLLYHTGGNVISLRVVK